MESEKRKKVFTTSRYFRRESGAMTVTCVVIHREPPNDDVKDMVAGFSFCAPEDLQKFSRKEGKKFAISRMFRFPVLFKNVQGISKTLMDFVKDANSGYELVEKCKLNQYTTKRGESGDFVLWVQSFLKDL